MPKAIDCPITEETLKKMYQYKSAPVIGRILGVSSTTVYKWLEAAQISRRSGSEAKKMLDWNGSAHPHWKGGRRRNRDGYILIYYPEHPRANRGYIFEHILVWEQAHEKFLPRDWVVHHLNGIKDDNRPENLVAFPRNGHSAKHRLLEKFRYVRIQQLEKENQMLRDNIQREDNVYRMSQLGQCPRALSAFRLGYEPLPEPGFLQLAAREGSRHEVWVISDLQEEGWQITDRQKEIALDFPALKLVGHIDGIARKDGQERLLEIKSLGRFRFGSFASSGFARFHDYAVQITAYHQAVGLPILYVVKDRDSGKRVNLELDRPPLDWEEVYEAVLNVEIAVRKKQLCPAQMTDDFTCRICRYRYLCQEEEKKPVSLPADVLRAAGLRRRAMELETEAKELRAEADPVLLKAAKEKGKLTIDDLAVTYVPAGESVSYPVTELRKLVSSDILEKVKKVKVRSEYIRVDDLRV